MKNRPMNSALRYGRLALLLISAQLQLTNAGAEIVEEITVTATREGESLAETAASVGIIDGDEIRGLHAAHPSEIMGVVPGVHVNVTGGEGHMTAIRQPITTAPVYLYLENGVPTRSTGFFNHNALYEINLPQAGTIEVSKGPGSALQGSDAIGGDQCALSTDPGATTNRYQPGDGRVWLASAAAGWW